MKEETSKEKVTQIKDAVFQLISYHKDVKAILSEAESICVSDDKNDQHRKDRPDLFSHCLQTSIVGEGIFQTAETCATQLMKLSFKLGKVEPDEKITLMKTIEIHIQFVKMMMKGQYFNRPRFLNILCNEPCVPVDVLYMLHNESVMSLDSYLQFKQTDPMFVSKFSDELLVEDSNVNNLEIIRAIFGMLISYSFPDKFDTSHSLRKISTAVLLQTLHKYLSNDQRETIHVPILLDGHMTGTSQKKYYNFLLQQTFTYQPSLNVMESISEQRKWKFAKLPTYLTEFFKHVLIVLDTSDITEILKQTLDLQEVNWYYYNAFWATFIVCTQGSRPLAEEFIKDLFSVGFDTSDDSVILKGFMIGRQCCQEGLHVFMTYQEWFQLLFGDSTTSVANSKKTFTLMMRVLTDLVPHDPPSCLKAHIFRPPFVPPKCKDLWTDYIVLAKTRLSDLKEPLEQTGMYEGTSGSSTGSKNQIEDDVQKALAAFEVNNKIPTAVMEASIFRKSYFIGKFIPVLLKPRPLPDIPDSRMKFIEALKKVEKIPPNMYRTYETGCKKEAENLLKGVFMEIDDDEDDDVEMTMTAMEQYHYRLSQLMDKIVLNQSSKQYPEIITLIKDRMNTLIDNEVQPINDNTITIDLDNPKLLPKHVKIVDGMLNLFCKASEACLTTDHPDLSWAAQFVDMLTEFRTLHKPLFVRVLKIVINQNGVLESHHITGLALLLCFLSVKWQSFGSVNLSPCTNGCCLEVQSFSEKLWGVSPINTSEQMLLNIRLMSSYLFCVFQVVDHSCILEEDYSRIYPAILLKKFMFLCQRLLPKTEQGLSYDLFPALHIYKSERWNQIQQNTKLTFKDWIAMELNICPNRDLLSHLDRQEYLYDRIYNYYLIQEKQDGGCLHDYRYVCSAMVEALIQVDIESISSNSYCHSCQQNRKLPTSRIYIMQFLQELSWLFPGQKSSQNKMPWLISQLKLLHEKYVISLSSDALVKMYFRIVCCLPRYLFYTDSLTEPCVDTGLVISIINGQLREHLSHGCVLQRDLFLYLIQGLVQVQPHTDVDRILTSCPILWVSLLVYYPHNEWLIKQVKIDNQSMISVIQWMNSEDENIGDCSPWMYSAALLSQAVNGKSLENSFMNIKSQRNQTVNLVIGEFVMMYTAHMVNEMDESLYIDVLEKLQSCFPSMYKLLPDQSQVENISSRSTLALLPFKLLSFLSNHQQHLSDQQYLTTVLNLYSQIVSLYDDPKHSLKSDLHKEIELSTFVKNCIMSSPKNVLLTLDQELIMRCGIDVMLTFQERFQN